MKPTPVQIADTFTPDEEGGDQHEVAFPDGIVFITYEFNVFVKGDGINSEQRVVGADLSVSEMIWSPDDDSGNIEYSREEIRELEGLY